MPYKYLGTEKYESGSKYGGHYGNLQLSYEIDSMNLISASVGLQNRSSSSTPYVSNTFMKDGDQNVVGRYQSFLDLQRSSGFSVDGNIDYQHTFKKDGQLLTLSYLVSSDPSENESRFRTLNDTILPAVGIVDKNRRTAYNSLGTEHTAQIDYTEPFQDGKHTMEFGVKYIFRGNASNSSYMLFNPASQSYDIPDPEQKEQNMNYNQQVFGAYGSYSFRLEKFSVRAGARLEGNIQDINFTDSADRGYRAKYLDFVPDISLRYKLNEEMSISLSYDNSISRPSIYYLDPYVDKTVEKTLSYGNPNLKSERYHNVGLSYGYYSQKVNLSLAWDGGLVNNAITQDHFVDTDGVRHITYSNIGKNYSTGLYLYFRYNPAQWLSMWCVTNATYNYYRNLDYSISSFAPYFYGGMYFRLPWKLNLSLGGNAMAPSKGYKTSSTGYYSYSISLRRSFLKDGKLNVGISVANPHAKYKLSEYSSFDKTFEYTSRYWSKMRRISINVSWRFGQMKAKIAKVQRGIENTDLKSGGSSSGGQSGGGM